jgi:hypothetical protein
MQTELVEGQFRRRGLSENCTLDCCVNFLTLPRHLLLRKERTADFRRFLLIYNIHSGPSPGFDILLPVWHNLIIIQDCPEI